MTTTTTATTKMATTKMATTKMATTTTAMQRRRRSSRILLIVPLTQISRFSTEAGEHILEFEEDHKDAFNIAILQMPGGHAHHHHHGHGDGPFEWAGVFEIADTTHTWSMQKVEENTQTLR